MMCTLCLLTSFSLPPKKKRKLQGLNSCWGRQSICWVRSGQVRALRGVSFQSGPVSVVVFKEVLRWVSLILPCPNKEGVGGFHCGMMA